MCNLTAGPEHTPPLEAALRGHAGVVQALLSSGRVDVNIVVARSSERIALMVMVEYGGVESESATKVLLSVPGTDVDFQDGYGMTALMLAVFGGTVGMVKQILAAGGNPNVQDNNGNTTLSHARDVEKIKALLGVPGIKPDLPNNEGRTALSITAESGEIEDVNALLASDNVNPEARDNHGKAPVSWIFGNNGLQGSSKKEQRKAILKRLLRIPAVDPNTEDHDGLTPLLLAIMSHQGHEYVEVLLSRSDLDVNRPQAGGLGSPFDAAKQTGNMATMALLRTGGAGESVDSARSAAMRKDSRAIEQTNGLAIDVSIISANQDGEVAVPWSRCYDSLRMVDGSNPDIRSGQNHVLEITASAVTVRFRRGVYDGRPNTWIGTMCAGHGMWQGEFFLTRRDLPLSSLLQEPWTGIVLGNSRSQSYTNLHDTTGVVIQEQKREQQWEMRRTTLTANGLA